MRKLLVALAFAFAPSLAHADCMEIRDFIKQETAGPDKYVDTFSFRHDHRADSVLMLVKHTTERGHLPARWLFLHKDDPKAQALHAFARALPARYKRLEWLDLREGKLPNPDVEYPDLGEPAAFACSNRICSFPSFNAEELQATVKQMAKLKPRREALN